MKKPDRGFIDEKAICELVFWHASTMTCELKLALADRLAEKRLTNKMIYSVVGKMIYHLYIMLISEVRALKIFKYMYFAFKRSIFIAMFKFDLIILNFPNRFEIYLKYTNTKIVFIDSFLLYFNL